MWPFSTDKHFFSKEDNDLIVQSIRDAERQTSGEIRVFIESHCEYVEPLDRAAEIFAKLKMENTKLRNGVLFYVAMKDHQLAIFADKGIHDAAGHEYWKSMVKQKLSVFKNDSVAHGIMATITAIGDTLKTYFPYEHEVDKNELPDQIIFGA